MSMLNAVKRLLSHYLCGDVVGCWCGPAAPLQPFLQLVFVISSGAGGDGNTAAIIADVIKQERAAV